MGVTVVFASEEENVKRRLYTTQVPSLEEERNRLESRKPKIVPKKVK